MLDEKFLIVKSSGESVSFDKHKLELSLHRSGADDIAIKNILNEIGNQLFDGITTNEVYKLAFKLLRKNRRSNAARYSLKKAIMELGPSGFPFEHFVGELLKQQGFHTLVGQLVEGYCIRHEVDVVATANKLQYLVECKFYNDNTKYANVQVPLYIHSRMNDIIRRRSSMPEYDGFEFQGCIFTNTRFTPDAANYGICSGLKLVSWDYPNGGSLKELVEKNNFYPVTILTSVDKSQKQTLIKNNVMTCMQLNNDLNLFNMLNLKGNKLENAITEVKELCS
jgi:hypothetical protein